MHNTTLNSALNSPLTIIAIIIFIAAYIFVILEEFIPLKKSKPILLASGLIWLLVAAQGVLHHQTSVVNANLKIFLLNFSELFLFLLVAMTYINVLEERLVFDKLRSFLVGNQWSYRQLFWITGILSFFISALADNLTTALAMGAVVLAVGKDSPKFISLACINVVIAANAGGVFSPFGDITTLMVWQANLLPFSKFFVLFLPSVVNYIIPAFFLYLALPRTKPSADTKVIKMLPGGKRVVFLFLLTIVLTIVIHHIFHLPPVIGMMMGLAFLQFYSFYTQRNRRSLALDVFPHIQKIEWDTLLFFYGIILSIGGLSTLGILDAVSEALYKHWDLGLSSQYKAMPANILIGLLSAIVDNIPLMFAVITMKPEMSEAQWLLLTLTTGVGGSLLSIGSAAGIALMGQSRGVYTFMSHLKWTLPIFLGFIASICTHFVLNMR